MIKIVLLCAFGMSTSILVKKMREVAYAASDEAEIEAMASADLNEVAKSTDCILLGPQIGYMLEEITESVPHIPVAVIDTVDYGMVNGAGVYNKALALIRKRGF